MQIDDFFVDVVLAVNVKGDCNKKFFLTQKYSLDWISSYSVFNNFLKFILKKLN